MARCPEIVLLHVSERERERSGGKLTCVVAMWAMVINSENATGARRLLAAGVFLR